MAGSRPEGGLSLLLLWVCIKNLRRDLGRHLVASAGVGLAVLLVAASLTGVTVLRRAALVPIRQFVGGDIMVMRGGFGLSLQSSGVMGEMQGIEPFDPEGLRPSLQAYGITENLLVEGFLYSNTGGSVVALLGRSGPETGSEHPTLAAGRFLDKDDAGKARVVVPLNEEAFRILNPRPGSTLYVRVPRVDDPEKQVPSLANGSDIEFEVVGTTSPELGSNVAYVPLSFLQEATTCRRVLWLGVSVDDYSRLDDIASEIETQAEGYQVITAPDILAMIDTEGTELQRSSSVLVILTLIVGYLAVVNTLLLLVRLRRPQIALMKILGFSSTEIALTLLIEIALATTMGAFLGYLAGGLVGSAFGRFGLGFSWVSLGYVLSALTGVIALSGFLPFLWTRRASAMEVMRNA